MNQVGVILEIRIIDVVLKKAPENKMYHCTILSGKLCVLAAFLLLIVSLQKVFRETSG